MNALFALWSGPVGTWGIADFAIGLVVICGIIAAVVVGVRAMGLEIPGWVKHLAWIVVIVFAVVAVIKILAMM